jgi:hypothetical protein
MASGYANTPLAKKLGTKEGFKIILHNQPIYYFKLFDQFPEKVEELDFSKKETADFIHLFCTSEEELANGVTKLKPALKKNGIFWISWPKGGSGLSTSINRDFIRDYVLDNGLVDVKVAAIDEDWIGLNLCTVCKIDN